MPFSIVRQDITKMNVDAIVNAANTDLREGGGVCGAIFSAAGAEELQAACDEVSPIKTGCAVITSGFALPAKYIIHAAGPIYNHWSASENETFLRSAYTESLCLAKRHQCASIAFPLISSGIYGYPKDKALSVAVSAIRSFLLDNELDVYLVVFDKESFQISSEIAGCVDSYIDEHYVKAHGFLRRPLFPREGNSYKGTARLESISTASTPQETGIDDFLKDLDEPFSDTLLRIIDEKGKTDVEVYKKANIDRKLFSKIRSSKGYTPSKRTILALAVALELTLAETNALLARAGYSLSRSRKLDVIVEYFIVSGNYDIFELNEVLFKYDQPLLGC